MYRVAARLAHRLPMPPGRLAASLSGRRRAAAGWIRWAPHRPAGTPLLWFHGASVGEALAAHPVVTCLRETYPALVAVLTHSSPAVERWPHALPFDRTDFLPLDEPGPVAAVLGALAPSLLVFARGDLWPELVLQAVRHRTPVAILGGTVRRGSLRLTPVARPLYRRLCREIAWIGAVTRTHADRWIRLGAAPGIVEVTGDPRHDLVLRRRPNPTTAGALAAWRAGRTVLVAGSTEPADEAVLLRAARTVIAARPAAGLLLVPHDPAPATLRRLVARAGRLGLRMEVWHQQAAVPTAPIVTVAETGLLFDLYGLGTLAYVGGGFRPGRLHAVIEPAALGLPVVFGPRSEADDAAGALLAAGGGMRLPRRGSAAALAARWCRWVDRPQESAAWGRAAQAALDRGAAARTAAALRAVLGRPGVTA